MQDQLLKNAVRYVHELYRTDSGGHDAAHSIRVYRNAMMIADAECACSREIVALAALLHDADDRKLFRTAFFCRPVFAVCFIFIYYARTRIGKNQ